MYFFTKNEFLYADTFKTQLRTNERIMDSYNNNTRYSDLNLSKEDNRSFHLGGGYTLESSRQVLHRKINNNPSELTTEERMILLQIITHYWDGSAPSALDNQGPVSSPPAWGNTTSATSSNFTGWGSVKSEPVTTSSNPGSWGNPSKKQFAGWPTAFERSPSPQSETKPRPTDEGWSSNVSERINAFNKSSPVPANPDSPGFSPSPRPPKVPVSDNIVHETTSSDVLGVLDDLDDLLVEVSELESRQQEIMEKIRANPTSPEAVEWSRQLGEIYAAYPKGYLQAKESEKEKQRAETEQKAKKIEELKTQRDYMIKHMPLDKSSKRYNEWQANIKEINAELKKMNAI